MVRLFSTVKHWAQVQASQYSGDNDRPLGSYLGALGTYSGLVAGLATLVAVTRRPLPERASWVDILLVAAATHKVSRLLTKDPVTSPLRAPFTRFAGTSGEAELAEEVRATGAGKTIGELLTCPFCVGQWVATCFVFGLVLAPRATRLAAATFTALAGADFLQLAYAKAQEA